MPRQPHRVSSQLLGGSCDKRLTSLQAGDLQPSFGCPSTYWGMQLHTQAPKLAAGTVSSVHALASYTWQPRIVAWSLGHLQLG